MRQQVEDESSIVMHCLVCDSHNPLKTGGMVKLISDLVDHSHDAVRCLDRQRTRYEIILHIDDNKCLANSQLAREKVCVGCLLVFPLGKHRVWWHWFCLHLFASNSALIEQHLDCKKEKVF